MENELEEGWNQGGWNQGDWNQGDWNEGEHISAIQVKDDDILD